MHDDAIIRFIATVFAEDFYTANVQLLYGNNFHNALLENNKL